MNSSFVSSNTKSSMPSPSGEPPPAPPPPSSGRSTRSPLTNSRLPGSTMLRRPPGPWWKIGSDRSLAGIETLSPRSRSVTLRPDTTCAAALRICALKRRRKRWRLTALRFLPDRRRSTSWLMPLLASGSLSGAQIPLGEQTHLLVGVALGDHALDEVLVLLLLVARRLGVEGDHRQQVLGAGEHALLDHRAQLLVAGPRRIVAVVLRAGAQHEVDHLVAEVLRVGDAGGLLDLLELGVELGAVEDLAGVGIAELLILDPHVGVDHVAVEDVLPVFRVGLQVGGLQFLLDVLRVVRRQVFLQVGHVALFHLGRQLFLLDLLLQHVEQVHRVGGDLAVVEVEYLGQNLESEAGRDAGHALVDAGEVP